MQQVKHIPGRGRAYIPASYFWGRTSENSPSETVWKIAEGVSSTLLWRQEAADRDFFDPSWPLSEPRFGINSEFPNSFGRGILRSWTSDLRSSPKLQAALSSLTSSEVYERSVEGHHGSVEGESFAKVV